MRTIKFSLFSDLHHYPGVFRSQTPEHLWQIQRRAEEEKVDFIIHCGDLTHAPHECQDFVGMYNDFHIPSYHCLGNHDTDGTPLEQTLRLYHMPDGHYYFDQNGFRMIVADPNYYFKGANIFTMIWATIIHTALTATLCRRIRSIGSKGPLKARLAPV